MTPSVSSDSRTALSPTRTVLVSSAMLDSTARMLVKRLRRRGLEVCHVNDAAAALALASARRPRVMLVMCYGSEDGQERLLQFASTLSPGTAVIAVTDRNAMPKDDLLVDAALVKIDRNVPIADLVSVVRALTGTDAEQRISTTRPLGLGSAPVIKVASAPERQASHDGTPHSECSASRDKR